MTTRDMVFVALFAALTAACAVFPPFQAPFVPAPIIVQNIGVMLAGSILGAKRGGLSLLLFVVLVALGLPLLTGWKGGFGVILGPPGASSFRGYPPPSSLDGSWRSIGIA